MINPSAQVRKGFLFKAYQDWCEESREYALGKRKFGEKLRERNFAEGKDGDGNHVWKGIGLLGAPTPPGGPSGGHNGAPVSGNAHPATDFTDISDKVMTMNEYNGQSHETIGNSTSEKAVTSVAPATVETDDPREAAVRRLIPRLARLFEDNPKMRGEDHISLSIALYAMDGGKTPDSTNIQLALNQMEVDALAGRTLDELGFLYGEALAASSSHVDGARDKARRFRKMLQGLSKTDPQYRQFMRELKGLYRKHPSLWKQDTEHKRAAMMKEYGYAPTKNVMPIVCIMVRCGANASTQQGRLARIGDSLARARLLPVPERGRGYPRPACYRDQR